MRQQHPRLLPRTRLQQLLPLNSALQIEIKQCKALTSSRRLNAKRLPRLLQCRTSWNLNKLQRTAIKQHQSSLQRTPRLSLQPVNSVPQIKNRHYKVLTNSRRLSVRRLPRKPHHRTHKPVRKPQKNASRQLKIRQRRTRRHPWPPVSRLLQIKIRQ